MAKNTFGHGIAWSGRPRDFSGLWANQQAQRASRAAAKRKAKDKELYDLTDWSIDPDKILPVYGREAAKVITGVLNQYSQWDTEDPSTSLAKLKMMKPQIDAKLAELATQSDYVKSMITPSNMMKSGRGQDYNAMHSVFWGSDSTLEDVAALHNPAMGVYAGPDGTFSIDLTEKIDPSNEVYAAFEKRKETKAIPGTIKRVKGNVYEQDYETIFPAEQQSAFVQEKMYDPRFRKNVVWEYFRAGNEVPEDYFDNQDEYDQQIMSDYVSRTAPRNVKPQKIQPFEASGGGSTGKARGTGLFTTSENYGMYDTYSYKKKDGEVEYDKDGNAVIEKSTLNMYTYPGIGLGFEVSGSSGGVFSYSNSPTWEGQIRSKALNRDTQTTGGSVTFYDDNTKAAFNGTPEDAKAALAEAGIAPESDPFGAWNSMEIVPMPIFLNQEKALSGSGASESHGFTVGDKSEVDRIKRAINASSSTKVPDKDAAIAQMDSTMSSSVARAYRDLGFKAEVLGNQTEYVTGTVYVNPTTYEAVIFQGQTFSKPRKLTYKGK